MPAFRTYVLIILKHAQSTIKHRLLFDPTNSPYYTPSLTDTVIQNMLKLFYSPGSCALASHIVLEEAGAPYETIRIDFNTAEQHSADFLAINPK